MGRNSSRAQFYKRELSTIIGNAHCLAQGKVPYGAQLLSSAILNNPDLSKAMVLNKKEDSFDSPKSNSLRLENVQEE